MISSADFTSSLPRGDGALQHRSSHPRKGPQPRTVARQTTSCRADPKTANVQFSCPPAFNSVAACVQFFVAADTSSSLRRRRRKAGASALHLLGDGAGAARRRCVRDGGHHGHRVSLLAKERRDRIQARAAVDGLDHAIQVKSVRTGAITCATSSSFNPEPLGKARPLSNILAPTPVSKTRFCEKTG